jgi:hypothetical protein
MQYIYNTWWLFQQQSNSKWYGRKAHSKWRIICRHFFAPSARNRRMESASSRLFIDNKTQCEKMRWGMRANAHRLFFSYIKEFYTQHHGNIILYHQQKKRYWRFKIFVFNHAIAISCTSTWYSTLRDYTCIIRCTIFHFTHMPCAPFLLSTRFSIGVAASVSSLNWTKLTP